MKFGFKLLLAVMVVAVPMIGTAFADEAEGFDSHVEKDVCYRTALPGSGRSQSEAMANARARIRDCDRGFSQTGSTCRETNPTYWYCQLEGTCCHWEP